jgi:hypothetical protein
MLKQLFNIFGGEEEMSQLLLLSFAIGDGIGRRMCRLGSDMPGRLIHFGAL